MGYISSVLSSSSQVHVDDGPVSGGGLRLTLFPYTCIPIVFCLFYVYLVSIDGLRVLISCTYHEFM